MPGSSANFEGYQFNKLNMYQSKSYWNVVIYGTGVEEHCLNRVFQASKLIPFRTYLAPLRSEKLSDICQRYIFIFRVLENHSICF